MNHRDFKVGKEFFTLTGRWECTDKGKRTIIAIKKDIDDKSYFNGPPYAVAEHVFDEDDIEGCVTTYREATGLWGDDFVRAERKRRKRAAGKVSKKVAK